MPVKTHSLPEVAPYGSWRSPLELAVVFERPSPPLYPTFHASHYYWVEARAQESGRVVLVRRDQDGGETCITPTGFSIRTHVHEYGGRCFTLRAGHVFFSNDADQRVYKQLLDPTSAPIALTPEPTDDTRYMFADLQHHPEQDFLLAVMECKSVQGDNQNSLAVIDTNARSATPSVIASGCDFYAAPSLNKNGEQLAWIQWNHPYMPWDQTELVMADINVDAGRVSLGAHTVIAGGEGVAISQPRFQRNNDLIFAMDRDHGNEPCDDFWNLYRYNHAGTEPITCDEKEYGAAHWVFGESRHIELDNGEMVAQRTGVTGDELVRLHPEGTREPVQSEFNMFQHLGVGAAGEVLATAGSPTVAPALISMRAGHGIEVLKQKAAPLAAPDISVARPICYTTRDGEVAHAYYYSPCNSRYSAPPGSLPPLLVLVHGGPTSRSANSLDLTRQYWTSLGFAVLDVNHRGSTGYGRRYRQSLLGRWGEMDVNDVVDGVAYLISHELIDRNKVCIRGRSAGGYVVLRALTQYPECFAAGACYFGIGNLASLAAITHKFEARYTDRLIGEPYDPQRANQIDSLYFQRSPIHFMDRVRSPMIILQGLDDKVVPPALSQEVVQALASTGVEHEYVEYSGEGHGFRKSETNIDALQRETAFFRRVFGLNE